MRIILHVPTSLPVSLLSAVCRRVMLTTAELHWESSSFTTALPLLLRALALARQHHLQALASETILHLAFSQVSSHSPQTSKTHLRSVVGEMDFLENGTSLRMTILCFARS